MKVKIFAPILLILNGQAQATDIEPFIRKGQFHHMDVSAKYFPVNAEGTTDWFEANDRMDRLRYLNEDEDGSHLFKYGVGRMEVVYSFKPGAFKELDDAVASKKGWSFQKLIPSAYAQKYGRVVYGKDMYCMLDKIIEQPLELFAVLQCEMRDNALTQVVREASAKE